ncbi:hypothetical protein LUZ63_006813 [Rhynchospora breviuscula]|uniref:Peptidase S54 rhomboid domain-containing protein n=1 Tax=Rhynchospora breviuscula TaxID=2022672 RepID=A0A9Q0CQH5_9POAL|nr:hypothetical protein LUZ63_006813 [Rhynchospora breviuscula]
MTRRLLASNLRRVLNAAVTPSPKPFSSPTSQQNPLSQSHLFSWQLKLHRSIFFSTYKLSRGQIIARTRNALPMGMLLSRGARLSSFSLQRRSGPSPRQIRSSKRRFWSYQILTPEGVILLLIGANAAVFILWRTEDPSFMRKHFMLSLDNFKSGRLHTLITNAFSHLELDHIISNVLALFFFGIEIAELFGPKFLLKLYLGGALSGSIFYLIERVFLVPSDQDQGWNNSRTPALGASAAVNAIVLLQVFLFPKSLIHLYMFIPVPAALMGAVWIATDLQRVFKGKDNVAGSVHLGGAFVAALVWVRIRKQI